MFDELIITRNKDNTYSMSIKGFKHESLKNKKAVVTVPIMRNVALEFNQDTDSETHLTKGRPTFIIPSHTFKFNLGSSLGITKSGLYCKIDTRKMRPTKIKRKR